MSLAPADGRAREYCFKISRCFGRLSLNMVAHGEAFPAPNKLLTKMSRACSSLFSGAKVIIILALLAAAAAVVAADTAEAEKFS